MKKRIQWIDIFRGILIFSMVLGHTLSGYTTWIYAFHMVAFFFVSGLTTNYDKDDLVTFIKKKFKSLMVPFFIINIVFIFLIWSLKITNLYSYFYDTQIGVASLVNLLKHFWTPDLGGATWFLVVLFLSSIFGKLLHDLITEKSKKKKELKKLVTSSIILVVFYYFFYSNGESIAYFLDLIPIGLFFITCGHAVSKKVFNLDKYFKVFVTASLVIFYFWFVSGNYTGIELSSRTFPNIIIFLLSSFGGIVTFTLISKLICYIKNKFNIKIKVLEYLGKNTLPILLYHFLGFRILFVILYKLNIVEINQLKLLTPSYTGLVVSLLTSLFAIAFSLLLNKIIILIKEKARHFNYKWLKYLVIIILIFVVGRWAIGSRNFFVFDDWNNLVNLPYINFSDFMDILPTDVYCSRPGGWFAVKVILNLFGLNYKMHAISMLLIHATNSILVYHVAKVILRKYKAANIISMMTSLIFALYPISTFASFWEAGMFDLFGCTLTLISILIFFAIDKTNENEIKKKNHSLKKIMLSIMLILVYYASLRTKEMFIGLPVALFMYSFLNHLDRHNKKTTFSIKKIKLKEFIKDNIYLIVMIVIMFLYFIFTRMLNVDSTITKDITDPYYYTFNPITMLKNLFAYIYVYFNTNSLVYGNVTDIIHYSIYYKVAILTILIIIANFIITKFIKKDYAPLTAIIFFVVLILPVLPMSNMRHVLYLYVPSIFLALITSIVIYKIVSIVTTNPKIIISSLIITLLIINSLPSINNFRDFWLNTATQDKNTYQYFVDLKKDNPKIENIYILDVPTEGYTSFYNGSGFIVRVAFDNPNLNVHLNKDDYNLEDSKTIVIEFNNYDFKILKSAN